MFLIKSIFILSATLGYCCEFCSAQQAAKVLSGQVASVEDGNTLVVSAEKQKFRVRLVGIDAPGQELSKQSRENLAALASGKVVSVSLAPVELQEGKHKLVVGKVDVGGLDISLAQVRSGFAWQLREFEKYQSPVDISLYADAEKDAVQAKRGVWGTGFSACKDAAVKTTVGTSANPRPKEATLPNVYGTALVEVTIDEGGKVVSARGLCGHPVLQTVAVRTALRAKYKPQSSRVTGTMVYNFVPD